MAKDSKNPGLSLDSSPARLAALKRLLGTLTAVKVDPKFARIEK